jgi:cathepsin L
VNVDRAYPYVGVDAKCRFSNMKPVGASAVRQVVPLPVGDEKALMAALAQEGPISVAIQVTYNFQAYAGGVLNDRTCSNKMVELNHGY